MDGKVNSPAKPDLKVELVVDKSKEYYCPLCLKDFKMPRILPCLDTFCEECLSACIPNSRIHYGFGCPICKTSTALPSKGEANKNWPAIFPLNTITELMASNDQAKEEEYCNRCKMENGSSTLATSFCVVCKEYFCDGCVKFHMSFKALADHKIILKNDPYIKLASSLKHVLNCKHHSEKNLDMFCKDHNCECCSTCFEQIHHQCSNCLKLSSYAHKKLQQKPTREILLHLREMESQLERFIGIKEKQLKLLEKRVKDLPDKIRNMRAKINEILNTMEQRIVVEGENILQEESSKMQKCTQRCKSLAASIRLSALVLKTTSDHGNDLQTYLTQQAITQKLDKIKVEVSENYTETKPVDIKIKFHQIFNDFLLLGQHKMAELEVKDVDTTTKPSPKVLSPRKKDILKDKGNQKVTETMKSNDGVVDVEFVSTFETLYPVDGIKPRYTGATYLPEGNVLLVDFSNNKCCLYDSEYDFVADYNFQKHPRNICHLEGKKVAVTIPMSNEIEILVIDKGIKSVKTVTTPHQCFGLTSLTSEKLVVSGHNRNTRRHFWAIITTGGKEHHYQEIDENVLGSIVSHVTVNGAKTCIYVSCAALEAVFAFTLDGQLVYRYTNKDLKYPYGVGVDRQDNMYVLGRSSNNLHQVSPEGICLRVISSTIPDNPRHICFTEAKDMFLITHGKLISEQCAVFRLKTSSLRR
ncbi:hypothetical protein ACJMK2_021572 [Sinanodonta woodiana]|uniref:Uncharacterized protein n=1 Tax=Sinanodonta woodiana TaxID=1069815 RepID=A0ABD3TGH0_SINWO